MALRRLVWATRCACARASPPLACQRGASTRASTAVSDAGATGSGRSDAHFDSEQQDTIFPATCLTMLTGASRGLGAAIARVLVERGPPLQASPARRSGLLSAPGSGVAGGGGGIPAVPVHHDLVLLASNPERLSSFVQQQLDPLLAHESEGAHDTSAAGAHAFVQPANASNDDASSSGSFGRSRHTTTTTTTRITTACFDLGDLASLEANISRLLRPAAATAAAAAATAEQPAWDSSTSTAAQPPAGAAGGAAAATSVGGGVGASSARGLLPLPPAAYTHVLLVHNAGQVGELRPVEGQSLDNVRRQIDLNVTSVAALTSAVLSAFLHAPLQLSPDAVPLQGASHPPQPDSASSASSGAVGRSQAAVTAADAARSTPAPPSQPQHEPRRRRRRITVVNISSVSAGQPYEHFSVYGTGKAARHMLMRCVAHEADLREQEVAGAPASAAHLAAAAASAPPSAPLPARVRALSYAPGAIDTEMQAAAREALPPGQLKAAFEANHHHRRLVDPTASARVLYDILAAEGYANGAHMDVYSAVAGSADGGSGDSGGTAASALGGVATPGHPLARGRPGDAPSAAPSGASTPAAVAVAAAAGVGAAAAVPAGVAIVAGGQR